MSSGVADVLREVRKLLPSQGPLEFFVHHNTFHELENLSFKDALYKVELDYEGATLKSIPEYRKSKDAGQISERSLKLNIENCLKKYGIFDPEQQEFAFKLFLDSPEIPEGNSALCEELSPLRLQTRSKAKFFARAMQNLYRIDIDEIISPTLFRFFSCYFDQGVSYWEMPGREVGILESFKYYYGQSSILSTKWERNLSQLIEKLTQAGPLAIISFCLEEHKLNPEYYEKYLFEICYRYKGWGGLILSFEKHPEWNKKPNIVSDFESFAAILVLSECAYIKSLNPKKQMEMERLVPLQMQIPVYSEVFLASASFFVSRTENREKFIPVVEVLTDFNRAFIWHQSYEENFYEEFLSSFQKNLETTRKSESLPKLQVLCCIDDREESFRRYIEESGDGAETFGIAGHFGLDIRYKGIFNAHFRAQCPDIIKPAKEITEELLSGESTRKLYSLWANFLWLQSLGSRTLVRGLFFQFLTGATAIFSLSLAIISPYSASRVRKYFKQKIDKKLITKLVYEGAREAQMDLQEMVKYANSLLKIVGLKRFSPVVVILGHGSHSLNNPHESAYNCGACGGARGGPNARLISDILNRKDVRQNLKSFGYEIPDVTIFVGGYHNTSSTEVFFFDTVDREDVIAAVTLIKKAAKRDALERCRRYEDVPLTVSSDEAFKHCLARANDYRQPRPEYNHATNALCIVGPRWMSRDLFLDRRAFLTSYEPSQDNENADTLRAILSAVGPVCSGINLEYYFSFMDNDVFGCGSKLPHNVTSLVGVMNGYQSDLLLGLSRQMVEIHDPFRLMLLVVCEKHKVEALLENLDSLNRLVKNEWIHLSIFDPQSQNLYRYREHEFYKQDLSDHPKFEYSSQYACFAGKREACQLGIVRKSPQWK